MDLSIIIINYKTRDITRACLDSVIRYTKGIDYEIILVDNASKDGLVGVVGEKYPNVVLIANSENVGFAKANNQGIKVAKGRHTLLLNSDTLISSNQFKGMVEYLDKHPEVGVLGPKLLNEDGSLQYSAESFPTVANVFFDAVLLSRIFKKSKIFGNRRLLFRDHSRAFVCDKVMGAAFLINGKVLDELAGLDEDYFMYYEETDFCYRAKGIGWKVIYQPSFEVTHLWNASSRAIDLTVVSRSIRSMTQFFYKRKGLLSALLINWAHLCGSLLLFPVSLGGLIFAENQRQRLYFRGNIATVQYYLMFGWVEERFIEVITVVLLYIASITLVLERFVFSLGLLNFYLYHLVFAAIVFWSVCIALRKKALNKLILPQSTAWKLLYIYFMYMLVSFVWGPDILHSLRAFIKLAIYFVTIKAINYLLPGKKYYQKILDFQLPIAVVISLVTWLQMLFWEYKSVSLLMLVMIGRPNVGFSEPDWLSIYLAFCCLYFYIRFPRFSWKNVFIGTLLLSALVLSSARGAYLSFAVVYAGILVSSFIINYKSTLALTMLLKKRVFPVIISGVMATVMVGLTLPVYADYLMARLSLNEIGILSRFALVQEVSEEIASSRTEQVEEDINGDDFITDASYDSMVESEQSDSVTNRGMRLFVGRGIGSWGYYLGMRERGIPVGGGAFNFIISNFYELGFVGIVLFLVTFFYPFVIQLKKLTIESAVYLLLASTFFINGMFSNTYLVAYVWILTFFFN